jgi:hypothetical protein
MEGNDDEGCLDERGALRSFASKLAPIGISGGKERLVRIVLGAIPKAVKKNLN